MSNRSNLREPTKETYNALIEAYDFYNREIFDGLLDPCLITLNRKKSTKGYFISKKFRDRNDEDTTTDEIALNPACFDRSVEEILSTLVHEMVHLWQEHHGSGGRGRYHNKEWADKMEEIGLMPSSTGKQGGKRTGDKMTHYILSDGLFTELTQDFIKTGFDLAWQEVPPPPATEKAKNTTNRFKFICPVCEAQAWGKESLRILCADCTKMMEIEQKDEDQKLKKPQEIDQPETQEAEQESAQDQPSEQQET